MVMKGVVISRIAKVAANVLVAAAIVVAFYGSARADSKESAHLARPCALVAASPPMIHVTAAAIVKDDNDAQRALPGVLRVDLLGKSNTLLGRQLVVLDAANDRLLSDEAWKLNGNQAPEVKCSLDSETAKWHSEMVVDNEPVITVNGVYLGSGSVAVSYYVYWEDFFDSRSDLGPTNELFWARLDGGQPEQIRVTAKPGKEIVARFDGVSPGEHQISIGQENVEGSPVWTVTFEMPAVLATRKL